MKKRYFPRLFHPVTLSMVFLFVCQYGKAQNMPPALPDTSRMTYNQISQGLKLFPFPSNNQSHQKQKEDEFDCYRWAMEQTGVDPLNLPKVVAPPPQTGPTGAAVGGAARGAAVGVAIGAIAGNAGRGAAIGAVAGGASGRAAGRQAQARQNQQNQAAVSQKEQEIWNRFVRAFSSCLSGKGYTINQ